MKFSLAVAFLTGATAFAPTTNQEVSTPLNAATNQFEDAVGAIAPTGKFGRESIEQSVRLHSLLV